jgi:hypothetical protein
LAESPGRWRAAAGNLDFEWCRLLFPDNPLHFSIGDPTLEKFLRLDESESDPFLCGNCPDQTARERQ